MTLQLFKLFLKLEWIATDKTFSLHLQKQQLLLKAGLSLQEPQINVVIKP